MAWKRWLWIIVAAGVLIAAIAWGFRPVPPVVETAVAKRGRLEVTVSEEGKTRLRDRYVVSAPVGGYVRRIAWKEGDQVRAGEVAAVIEPRLPEALDVRTREQAEARVAAAEVAVRVAEARMQQAEAQARVARTEASYWVEQLKREEALLRTGDIPEERVDRTRSEAERTAAALRAAEQSVATARAEAEQARAEVASARAMLVEPGSRGGRGTAVSVRWPVSGRILKVVRESEGFVDAGAPLIELGNTRAMEVEVEVLSADAVKIQPGMPVVLTQWGGAAPLEAQVRVVEPGGFTKVSALGVEEQRVRVISDITSPEQEWAQLGDGYRVEASFVLWRGEDVLQIPASALFRADEGWAVFVVAEGIARRQAVEIGHRNGLSAEILSGVKEGDVVVAHPDDTVEDGKAVEVR